MHINTKVLTKQEITANIKNHEALRKRLIESEEITHDKRNSIPVDEHLQLTEWNVRRGMRICSMIQRNLWKHKEENTCTDDELTMGIVNSQDCYMCFFNMNLALFEASKTKSLSDIIDIEEGARMLLLSLYDRFSMNILREINPVL